MLTKKLLCRFCLKEMGKIEYPELGAGAIVFDDVADNRCEECSDTHGSYKEMWEIFDRDMRDGRRREDSNKDFDSFIAACEFSAPKFVERSILRKPELFLHKVHTHKMFEDHRKAFIEKHLADVNPDDHGAFVKGLVADHPEVKSFDEIPAAAKRAHRERVANKEQPKEK